jgi:hypothetical protein
MIKRIPKPWFVPPWKNGEWYTVIIDDATALVVVNHEGPYVYGLYVPVMFRGRGLGMGLSAELAREIGERWPNVEWEDTPKSRPWHLRIVRLGYARIIGKGERWRYRAIVSNSTPVPSGST